MKIKEIVSQSRRDLQVIYVCEHCGHEEEGSGYDDRYFHESVIPDMKCPNCKKKAGKDYVARATKFPDYATV